MLNIILLLVLLFIHLLLSTLENVLITKIYCNSIINDNIQDNKQLQLAQIDRYTVYYLNLIIKIYMLYELHEIWHTNLYYCILSLIISILISIFLTTYFIYDFLAKYIDGICKYFLSIFRFITKILFKYVLYIAKHNKTSIFMLPIIDNRISKWINNTLNINRTMPFNMVSTTQKQIITREIMVPRTDIVYIKTNEPLYNVMSLSTRSGFSRIPVINEDIDHIIGIVHIKDILYKYYNDSKITNYKLFLQNTTVSNIIRNVIHIPDVMFIYDALKEMQKARCHISIITDEYGGTAGLLTIEDILEEIVGEIVDEYDISKDKIIEPISNNITRINFKCTIEEFNKYFHTNIIDNDVDTISGLIAKYISKAPIIGSTININNLKLTVESLQGRRNMVNSIIVKKQDSQLLNHQSDNNNGNNE